MGFYFPFILGIEKTPRRVLIVMISILLKERLLKLLYKLFRILFLALSWNEIYVDGFIPFNIVTYIFDTIHRNPCYLK